MLDVSTYAAMELSHRLSSRSVQCLGQSAGRGHGCVAANVGDSRERFHRGCSYRQTLLRILDGMILENSLGKLDRFGYCFFGNSAAPLGGDRAPGHSFGNLFQNLRHHYPCSHESRLAMADIRIGDNVAAQELFSFFWHILACSIFVDLRYQAPSVTICLSFYSHLGQTNNPSATRSIVSEDRKV